MGTILLQNVGSYFSLLISLHDLVYIYLTAVEIRVITSDCVVYTGSCPASSVHQWKTVIIDMQMMVALSGDVLRSHMKTRWRS